MRTTLSRARKGRGRASAKGKAAAALLLATIGVFARGPGAQADESASPDAHFTVGGMLGCDDFSQGLGQWRTETESGGAITARDGALEIDVPGGCTVWFRPLLDGPLVISYEATAVAAGGANDRVSDLNCFWMATDARSTDDLFATSRSGKFADYDHLRCYYVGLGGNSNRTTRFRRYVGVKGDRPLLPQNDLTAKEFLLTPNTPQTIQLVAAGRVIGYFRDGRRLFAFDDPEPYPRGWFAFRTVRSHLRIRHFRVDRLVPRPDGTGEN